MCSLGYDTRVAETPTQQSTNQDSRLPGEHLGLPPTAVWADTGFVTEHDGERSRQGLPQLWQQEERKDQGPGSRIRTALKVVPKHRRMRGGMNEEMG